MPDFIDVFHSVEGKDSFYQPDRWQQFLQSLATRNSYLASERQEEVSEAWHRYRSQGDSSPESDQPEPAHLFVPGISAELEQEGERFLQGEQDELSIAVYSTVREGALRGVDYRITFYPQEAFIRAVMDDIYPSSQPYRGFLELLVTLYNSWHPFFGYRDDGTKPAPDLAAVREGTIAWLYDINIWGPQLVEHLGSERVLNTPAWYLKQLDDDGVLLAPQFYYSDGQDQEYAFTGDEAAAHLGLRWEIPEE